MGGEGRRVHPRQGITWRLPDLGGGEGRRRRGRGGGRSSEALLVEAASAKETWLMTMAMLAMMICRTIISQTSNLSKKVQNSDLR